MSGNCLVTGQESARRVMKAFLVGLIFLVAVGILTGIGVLLFPLLIVMGWFLRLALVFLLVIFAIWLLGKFIVFIWERFISK